MNNSNIATELIKIAKSLVSENDAEFLLKEQAIQKEIMRELSSMSGVPVGNLDEKMIQGKYLQLSTKFPPSKAGILHSIYKEITLKVVFSVDKVLGDGSVWGEVSFAWEHVGGGSNGFGLGNMWYFPETGKVISKKRYSE